MASSVIRVAFVLLLCTYFGHPTRFLPMVVWDHVNPQLSCKCNWFVIPHVKLYDRLEFVCPTLRIAFKQVDGYSRPVQEMNENIFRRKWNGTKEDLRNSIRNGSIHSFCNPSSTDNARIHSCRNGAYDSAAVTFKPDSDKTSNYEPDQIYIFYNNGDNGQESTLRSKKVKCSMLFAVYVSNKEKVEHDITFGKKAFTDRCNCNRSLTCVSSRSATTPTSRGQPFSRASSIKVLATEELSLNSRDLSASTTAKPSGNCENKIPAGENPEVKCKLKWLTIELFIGSTIGALLAGIFGTIACVEVRRQVKKKGELVERKSSQLFSKPPKEPTWT